LTLLDAAKKGDVLVADVFAATRSGQLSEEEAKEVLLAFERARNLWSALLHKSKSST
jgi:hypothetical protein